jgi:predicted acetyltransferase
MSVEVRAIGLDELDALMLADERGFGAKPPGTSRSWAEAELDRTRVAFEDGVIVGASRTYSFELTMPGCALMPAAAVSWVAVIPTHRRRGVVTRLMRALHDDARERGEPAAMLTASESVIYGRFGYGVATWRLGMSASRQHVQFRDDVPDVGTMRFAAREEAEEVLPPLYDRVRSARAGMVSRPDYWWPSVFWGLSEGPDKAFFVAVHRGEHGRDDGYVAYEVTGDWIAGLPDRRLLIWDLQATSSSARAALWRYLFGVDLIGTVSATNLPIDEPLRHLVRDGRRIRTDHVNDGLWIAPLDVPGLLSARRYATEGHLVLEVHAPDGNVANVALDGSERDAKCVASSEPAELVCTTATLGACILGGNKWSELADAALVDEQSAGALTRADAMFACTPAPAMVSYF